MAHFRENYIENLQNAMLYLRDKSILTSLPVFNFPGALVTSGWEFVRDSHKQAVTGGTFYCWPGFFCPNQNNNESQSQLVKWFIHFMSENLSHNTIQNDLML